ncbi:DUF4265 domain-containing protein [Micromonospora sp. NPDC049366]|uniref:DUF4265 domain-containing protein n=1 Tax=Micromonospora sp. NPDC049366 TaxID=3364271 RepID=UPI003789A5BC
MAVERLRLVAGKKRSGELVYEEVLGELQSDGTYRVAVTPGLVLGTAAGDVIEVDKIDGSYEVVTRGGNIAVQVYGDPAQALRVKDEIKRLGGWHDGGLRNLTVFTIPYRDGFERLEAVLNSLLDASGSLQWFYGNVYESSDGVTPLGWWE